MKPYRQIFRRFFRTANVERSRCPTTSGADPPEHTGTYKLYKRLALFLALPVIAGLSVMLYLKKKACEVEREPFHKYPYLRLRSKLYPWKEGQKTLFHNPRVNPLPDGYEDEAPEGAEKCD